MTPRRYRFALVRLNGAQLETLTYLGPACGIPAGWSIHKRMTP